VDFTSELLVYEQMRQRQLDIIRASGAAEVRRARTRTRAWWGRRRTAEPAVAPALRAGRKRDDRAGIVDVTHAAVH
jgi:hypothetical protein